jgi:hypothetical protein
MVIDDAPLSALTAERLRTVMAPKAHGAWLLHEATQDMELDCFVMFSSVSSIFGNPAQGNYAAANSFLDSLAHHRRALGLPALTMSWGVLGGGVTSRNEHRRILARKARRNSPGEVMSLLESSLSPATRRSRQSAWTGQVAAILPQHLGGRCSEHSRIRRRSGRRRNERLAAQDRIRRAEIANRSSPQRCAMSSPFCASTRQSARRRR